MTETMLQIKYVQDCIEIWNAASREMSKANITKILQSIHQSSQCFYMDPNAGQWRR